MHTLNTIIYKQHLQKDVDLISPPSSDISNAKTVIKACLMILHIKKVKVNEKCCQWLKPDFKLLQVYLHMQKMKLNYSFLPK